MQESLRRTLNGAPVLSSLLIGAVIAFETCRGAEASTSQSSPEAAALGFARAMDAGDTKAAKEASFGGENELRLIGAMADMTRSHQRLVAAAVAKFGDRGKELGGSYAPLGFEATVRQSAVTVKGDTALVREKPGIILLKLVRSPDGQWRIDVAGCMADYAIDQIGILERASRIAGWTACEVAAGLYVRVADVTAAMAREGYPREERNNQVETAPATTPDK
jgi:hypothetical protein